MAVTRRLTVLPATDPRAVLVALRSALTGGPALLPRAETARPADCAQAADLPHTVEQRIAVVIETSGSTGEPKRVTLSADALLASAAASDTALGGPGQWLLALPTHYIAGINVLVRSIAAETEPIVLPAGHFDAREFVAASARLSADLRFTSLVPAQLGRIVQLAESDERARAQVRRFTRILVGGQALSAELSARASQLGLAVTRSYGSSETSGGCVYDGVPIGSASIRIVDGEVQLAGPMLAEGYLGNPELTDKSFVFAETQRWYRSGDFGHLSKGHLGQGLLTVTGRLDSILISGGIKVSLDEVERLVRTIDSLADAVVVRAPSLEWGEVPVVFSAGSARLHEVKELVVEKLGRAAAPVALITLESVPLLPSGKPDRVSLTAFAESRSAVSPRSQ